VSSVAPAPAPSKLSDEALAKLSLDLMQNLEKGLSQRDLVTAKPASSPAPAAAPLSLGADVPEGEPTKQVVTRPEPSENETTREMETAATAGWGSEKLPRTAEASETEPTRENVKGDASRWGTAAAAEAAPVELGSDSDFEATRKHALADAQRWAQEAAKVPLPPSSERSIDNAERLNNVDSAWSETSLPKAAPVLEPSVPELSNVDSGWGSDKLPTGKGEGDT
jgi:hypothetical protein